MTQIPRTYDNVDYGRISPVEKRTIALDTAQSQTTPLELILQGTTLFADLDSDGKVYVRFNSLDAPRLPISAGMTVNNWRYKRVYLDWTAQAGKKINLFWGSDASFVPLSQVTSIGTVGTVGAVTDITNPLPHNEYDVNVWKIGSIAGVTSLIGTGAGGNQNGLLVLGMGIHGYGTVYQTMLAKSTEPSAWNDTTADLLAYAYSSTGTVIGFQPFVIPGGQAIWYGANSDNTAAGCWIFGKLL